MQPPISAIHLVVRGRVQGVGFRYFTQEVAIEWGLTGWVRNLPDGSVEVYAQGPRSRLQSLRERLNEGPPLSRVESVVASWAAPSQVSPSFDIL